MSDTVAVDWERAQLESLREQLRSSHLAAVRQLLPDKVILAVCAELGLAFRDRLLSPIVTVFHYIAAALVPDASFAAAWRIFGSQTVTSGALANARKRLPGSLLSKVVDYVVQLIARASERHARWQGHRVIALDGTCVSMPATKELFDAFGGPHHGGQPPRYPVARAAAAILVGSMAILTYGIGSFVTSEIALVMGFLASFSPGDLLIGDRRFAGANYYARFISQKLEFITRAHQKLKIERLASRAERATGDFITNLRVLACNRKEDPTLPKRVTVRLVRSVEMIRGRRQTIWLVTSLLDAARCPAAEIARLYGRRWRIETVFGELKVVAGADVLRSQTAEGIRKEFAARVIAVNLVRALMIEAAGDEPPTRLSFTAGMRLIMAISLRMATAPAWEIPLLYKMLLEDLSGEEVPERPGRNEPRALSRDSKRYRLMHLGSLRRNHLRAA